MKDKLFVVLTIILFTFGITGLANASLLTDPTSIISYSGNIVTLHKELSGYGNYGIADSSSDILYNGDSGSWMFDLTSVGISSSDFLKASLTASLTLDDTNNPTSDYSMSVNLLGAEVFSGFTDTISLVHGSPYGTKFSNWTDVSFESPALANLLTVTMQNITSPQNGWIGIDYIELKLTPSPVPEPTTMLLFSTGLAGLIGVRIKRKKKGNSNLSSQ